MLNNDAVFKMRKKPVGYSIIIHPEHDTERLFETNNKFIINIGNIFSFFRHRGNDD